MNDSMGGWHTGACSRCGKYHDFNQSQCYQPSPLNPSLASGATAGTLRSIIPQGWQCPRCLTIYAPDVKQCTCATVANAQPSTTR